ncbi:type III secretion system gatekeeper subunit SctW [Phaeobacter sp. HF9A]|uniref:type III secretion system gatekeeper subunit SctW n=1 Tax=Phaeobacter sp. HF9A TaxID=2721561 RepID=UPI00142FCF25|nr:type III secretion system gatekeeper subunit SctW [Phaeobacter sp. HF9A]
MSITSARETVQSQIATQNAASPVGSEVMAEQLGKSRVSGESVRATPQQADITDALEELGMAAATRGKSDLDKMKLRRGASSNLEALGRIAEYYDKLPDMPSQDRLRDLAKQFAGYEELFEQQGGGSGMATAEDLRELLQAFDDDITHQFAALETIRENAVQSGASAGYVAVLDTLRQEMRQPDVAREIRAGFASAGQAQKMAGEIGTDPEAYRNSYREMLRDTPNLGRLFGALRQFDLSQNYDQLVDSFIATAGADISSFGPSTDAAQLGGVVTELSKLKTLRTVLDMTASVTMTLDRMLPPGQAVKRPDSEEIAARLLGFTSSPTPSRAEAEKLVKPYEAEPPEVPVAVTNLLRDLHGQLPDAAFSSDSARLSQSRILVSLSDRLVAAEDAQYDA